VSNTIGPCRALCETVRARCHPVLSSFGFNWPASLDCSRFPKYNNHENMCMEGPGETQSFSLIPSKIQPLQTSCKYLYKSHLYVRLNRSNRCTPLCEADILFEKNEKQFSWFFIASWSIAAGILSIVALLCLILSDARWDKNLLPLVVCHCE
jgi:frizzled protein 4